LAKQPINLVERHLEKGVLGLCMAALLGVVAMFGISTPNTTEIGTELVGPDAIDQRVLDAAHKLRDKLKRAPVDTIDVENPVPMLMAASSPLEYANLDAELPSPVPYLPHVPDAIGSRPVAGELELAKVIAPEKPVLTHSRAMVNLVPPIILDPSKRIPETAAPPANRNFDAAVNWVTVAVLFDQQQQISECRSSGYDINRTNPYIVSVDLQRREKLLTGQYSDWRDVTPYLPIKLAAPPTIDIVQGQTGLIPTESSADAARKYFNLVKKEQSDLVRPLFPEVVFGQGWLYPKIGDTDVHALDRELCTSDSANSCQPRPYPLQWDVAPTEDTEQLSAKKLILTKLGEAQDKLNGGDWKAALEVCDEILKDNEDLGKKEQDEVAAIQEQARQREIDEKKGRIKPKNKDDTEDDPTAIRRSRYQLVWAHDVGDASTGGAESGKTYQYRVRVNLYNRYCAVPTPLKSADDAKQVLVAGQWSAPSDDMYIEPDTQFFLTGGSPNSRSGAKVSVFKWYEGVWVEHRFPVQIGKPLGGTAREQVGITSDGTPDKPPIAFDTGATVVDIDYDYRYRVKKKKGKAGMIVTAAQKTIALVYLDHSGQLHQRVLAADKAEGHYKEYKARVYDPKTEN